MHILIKLALNTLAVVAAAYLVPGVKVEGLMAAFIAALVLGILNTFLKPILILLTLPITLLTLGLFTLVINAALVLLATSLVPGFVVSGFVSAVLFAFVLSLVNSFLGKLS
jgi:putative membrane protein